jgi:hypothetical protein
MFLLGVFVGCGLMLLTLFFAYIVFARQREDRNEDEVEAEAFR